MFSAAISFCRTSVAGCSCRGMCLYLRTGAVVSTWAFMERNVFTCFVLFFSKRLCCMRCRPDSLFSCPVRGALYSLSGPTKGMATIWWLPTGSGVWTDSSTLSLTVDC